MFCPYEPCISLKHTFEKVQRILLSTYMELQPWYVCRNDGGKLTLDMQKQVWTCYIFCLEIYSPSLFSTRIVRPSYSISHKISKSDCSGDEPVICDSTQHTTWVAKPPSTSTTNNKPTLRPQQTTEDLDTGNEHEIKTSRKTSQLMCKTWITSKRQWDGGLGPPDSHISTIVNNRKPHVQSLKIRHHVNSAWQTVSYQQSG